MKTLEFLAPLFRAHCLALLLALALSFLTLLAGMALLGVSGWFLTAAALTTMAASFNLFGPSSLIRGLSLLRILSRYGEKLVGHDATLRLLADLRTNVFGRLFARLPLARDGISHGDLVSRLTADIDALESIFIVGIGPLVTSVLSGIAMAALIGVLLPAALAAYCVSMVGAVIVVPLLLFASCRRHGEALITASAEARNRILDASSGHADLIAFGQTQMAADHFAAACGRLRVGRDRLALRAGLATAAIQILTGTALVGTLVIGVKALKTGTISAPTLVGLLLATLASFEAAAIVVRGVARFGTALAAARRIRAVTTTEPEVHAPRNPLPMPTGNDLILEKVGFSHHPTYPIFRDIDLRVRQGERVALIGRSGCGKSTLLSLLVRLHNLQAGRILLGGVDVAGLDPDSLRTRIALLTQDAPVFMGSIRDNLLIGDPAASDSRLMEVLAGVRLDTFVRGFPEQLDTHVGEAGSTLSVGQVRRLCLARALLSKADILLLDEPTSSVDAAAEAMFFADLAEIAIGRTIIVATHAPLAVLGSFDRRYRMENGRLFPAE